MRAAILFILGLVLGACAHPTPRPQAPTAPSAITGPRSGLAERLRDETVAFVGRDREGDPRAFCSGVWVSESSIITAAHCVEALDGNGLGSSLDFVEPSDMFEAGSLEERPFVVFNEGRVYAVDGDHDLALVRGAGVTGHGYAHTTLAEVRPGAIVSTMGHPLGLWWSYSSGEVSAVRSKEIGLDTVWIQSTAPISPGNSGGGLFDEQGHLLGIASRCATRGQNLNFYVHGQYVDALLRRQGRDL